MTPWTITYQAPWSTGFSRQEYWSGLPFPSPGDLPNPGIEPGSPTRQAVSLSSEPPGKPRREQNIPPALPVSAHWQVKIALLPQSGMLPQGDVFFSVCYCLPKKLLGLQGQLGWGIWGSCSHLARGPGVWPWHLTHSIYLHTPLRAWT